MLTPSHILVPRPRPAPLCVVGPAGVASALQTGTPSVRGRGHTARECWRLGTCTQVCNGLAASSGVTTPRHGSRTQPPSCSKTTPTPPAPVPDNCHDPNVLQTDPGCQQVLC